ncbi:M28 family peptidase [Streptomyces carpinensis]|uniref:M28 family peptidase n=2 Tax=Streptomyces carpinensis TaxID=66369 RepID=A0ABV1W3P5_9ACTN|nr:M28 family peptidase [Streptomyces carpinensis]
MLGSGLRHPPQLLRRLRSRGRTSRATRHAHRRGLGGARGPASAASRRRVPRCSATQSAPGSAHDGASGVVRHGGAGRCRLAGCAATVRPASDVGLDRPTDRPTDRHGHRALGFKPRLHRQLQWTNLIASLGAAQEDAATALIGAHLDSVSGSPGADDNASGVAVVLETARLLTRLRIEPRVTLAVFDMEELGLIGARHAARGLSRSRRIAGMICLESVGLLHGRVRQPAAADRLLGGLPPRCRGRQGRGPTGRLQALGPSTVLGRSSTSATASP